MQAMSGQFSLDLSRLVKKAKGNLDLVTQKVTFDLFEAVILKSPVLTGRFRANWQASAGTYGSTPVDSVDPTGASAISGMSSVALHTPAGSTVYLTNPLPYSIPLEYGYSQQAPQGMVRVTVTEYQARVNQIVRTLKK